MKISPYISFTGNCAEAITLYEKAFNTKAKIMYYKDTPQNTEYPMSPGTENFIMHAQFEIGGETVMLCDVPPEFPVTAGSNVAVMVEFDNEKTAKTTFGILRENANVTMELEETFWSKCFGSLTDKFGINWNISIVEEDGCNV